MIIFRPQRSTLDEAMKEAKEFDDLESMKQFICSIWNTEQFPNTISMANISLSEEVHDDIRIGWKNTHYVLTNRIGDKSFEHPQCIGMCTEEYSWDSEFMGVKVGFVGQVHLDDKTIGVLKEELGKIKNRVAESIKKMNK